MKCKISFEDEISFVLSAQRVLSPNCVLGVKSVLSMC